MLLHPRVAKSALAAFAVVEAVGLVPADTLVACEHHLCDTVAALNGEWLIGVIYYYNTNLP